MLKVCWPVLLLSACTVDAIDFTGKTCEQDADCQGGLVCVEGICAAPGTQPSDGGSGDAGDVANDPTVGNLRQLAAGGGALPAGSTVKEIPELLADVSGGEVRLEVELIDATSPFAGTPNFIGDYTSGGSAKVQLNGLKPGSYRWQARAVNRDGRSSPFAVFNDGAMAFTLLPKAIEGSLTIEDNAAYTRTPVVTLRLQAISKTGATISQMEFSNDGDSWSGPEPFAPTRANWNLAAGDGAKKVFARVIDSVGESVIFEASILLDATKPELAATVGNGSGFINSTQATVTLQASDATSGLADVAWSDDGLSFGLPEGFRESWSWTLSAGDGEKVRYARVTDKAGNAADLRISVVLDTRAPKGALLINAGAGWTSKRSVELNIDGTDENLVATMAFSDDGVTFSDPKPFDVIWRHTLTDGDGEKTVTVRLADAAGNTVEVTDSIGLDTEPPTISGFAINGGAQFTNKRDVELAWTADDADSGLSTADATDGTATGTLVASPSLFRLEDRQGQHDVILRVVDKAGNEATATSSIVFDDVAPAPPGQLSAARRSRSAELTFSPSTDATSGLDHYEIGIATQALPQVVWTQVPELQSPILVKDLVNGVSYQIALRAVDKAGNVSVQTGTIFVEPRFAFEFQHRKPAPVTWHGAVHLASREVVLVGEQGEVAKSKDQFTDNNPTRRDSGTDATLYGVTFDGDWTVAVGAGGVITASRNRGDTWTLQVNGSGSTRDLYAVSRLNDGNSAASTFIAVGEAGAAVVGTMRNDGTPATFNAVSLPTSRNLRAVASASSYNLRSVIVGDQGTVLYTLNGGQSWSAATLPSGYGQMALRAVTWDPEDRAYFIGGEPPGPGLSSLLRSTDDGKSWVPVAASQLPQLSIYALSSFSSGFNASVHVGGVDFIGGREGREPSIWRFSYPQSMARLSVSNGKGRVLSIAQYGGQNYVTAAGEDGAVYIGSGSSQLSTASRGAPISLRGMVGGWGTSPYLWVLGDGGYIAYSGDRGSTWSTQYESDRDLRAIAAIDTSQLFAVGEGGAIVRGGLTTAWSPISSPVTVALNDVDCAQSTCVAVGEQATVISSGPAGGAWQVLNQEAATGVRLMAVHLFSPSSGVSSGVAVGNAGAVRYVTATGTIASATITNGGELIAVDSSQSGSGATYLLAMNNKGGVFRSNDGGSNWALVGSLGAGVVGSGLANAGGALWFAVSKGHGAFISRNDGASWTPVRTDFVVPFGFVHAPAANSTWIGGDAGALLYSPFPDLQ